MAPSPKTPQEKKLPGEDGTTNEELPHPPVHSHHEFIASTDESAANSDNDDHHPTLATGNSNGYCLLSQDSEMNQPESQYESEDEDEDEEFLRFATLRVLASTDDNRPVQTSNPPVQAVWSARLESEPFPVDDEKANYIKNLMSSIQLPESSIPVWAQFCTEQDWQAKLREKIACRQTTLFANDKQ